VYDCIRHDYDSEQIHVIREKNSIEFRVFVVNQLKKKINHALQIFV